MSASAQAIDTTLGWHHALVASMNLSQIGFTDWAPGGTNALSYLAAINGKSSNNDVVTLLENTYKLDFGQTRLGDQGLRKTDDEINLESILTYKVGVHINPYAALSLLSQFAPGFKYNNDGTREEISNFFDPGYIKQSAGIGFKFSDVIQTRIGAALREIVANRHTNFSDNPETAGKIETFRIEGGLESVSELELPVDDNVLLRAKLGLFSPLKSLDRIILHGETTLVAKVSKYFNAQVNALFVNEPDISPFTQIKEALSLGISYSIL